ncbi:MAG: protein HslO [Deltaproteobacteria bacterium]|nr:MAG: protein HslO [Deltaproteobacteria bacterium]
MTQQMAAEALKAKLKEGRKDRLHTFMMADDQIRGAFLTATRVVKDMREAHGLGVLETLVLGHAYMGTLLSTACVKGDARMALSIDCSGPIKGLSVEASSFGEVRGYLKQNPIPVTEPLEDFNLSPYFGAGFLTLTRRIENAREPYSGKIILQHGNIAQDIAQYFLESEQIPTAITLSITFDKQGEVRGAAGLFLQALPGANDRVLAEIETAVTTLPSIGDWAGEDTPMETRIQPAFAAMAPRILASKRAAFYCPCNQEKISAMLHTLPVEDLKDMATNGPFPVSVTCHNCNTHYHFSQEALERLYQNRTE